MRIERTAAATLRYRPVFYARRRMPFARLSSSARRPARARRGVARAHARAGAARPSSRSEMRPRRRLLGRLRASTSTPARRCSRQAPTSPRIARPRSRSSSRPSTALLRFGARRHADHDGASPRGAASTPTASGAATSTCAAAATRRSTTPTCQRSPTQLAPAASSRVDGPVVGDESLFDACAAARPPATRYDSDLGGALSALTLSHGRSGRRRPVPRRPPGAASPPRRCAKARGTAGVDGRRRRRRGVAASAHDALATLASPPMRHAHRA